LKVLNFVRPENGLTEDPLYYLNFERYESDARDCYLFMADFISELCSGKYEDKEKVVLTLEEPNFCVGDGPQAVLHERADTILTLCPYTASLFGNREAVFFPFNEDWIPEPTDKVYDIAYFGSFPWHVPWHSFMENVVFKHNYRYGHYTSGNMPHCTYADKIKTFSQSKIALTHGLCSLNPGDAHRYISYPRGAHNGAFSHLEQGQMPQIKSRMFEAAFSRSLILCYRDPWNPIENFFTPNIDFMYFDNENDLREKVEYILNHYNEFDVMRSSAFEKAQNTYTTKHFVERYLQ